jgi:hypothetical protein
MAKTLKEMRAILEAAKQSDENKKPVKRGLSPQPGYRTSGSTRPRPTDPVDPDPGASAREEAARKAKQREDSRHRTAIRKAKDPELKAQHDRVNSIFARARKMKAHSEAAVRLATQGNELISRASSATSREEKRAAIDDFHDNYTKAYAAHHGEENMNDQHHKKHLQDMYNTIRSVKVSGGEYKPDYSKAADAQKKVEKVLRHRPKHDSLIGATFKRLGRWIRTGDHRSPEEIKAQDSASGKIRREDIESNKHIDTVKRVIAERRELPGTMKGKSNPRKPGKQRVGRRIYSVSTTQTGMVNKPKQRQRIDG